MVSRKREVMALFYSSHSYPWGVLFSLEAALSLSVFSVLSKYVRPTMNNKGFLALNYDLNTSFMKKTVQMLVAIILITQNPAQVP